MNIFTKHCKGLFPLLVLLLALSGCNTETNIETTSSGGGTDVADSDAETTPGAGGGSETGSSDTPSGPVNPFAGTYNGTATVTATASPPFNLSQTETVPVTVTINNDGVMSIQSNSDLLPAAITLNGNTFSQTQTFNDQAFGAATCSGSLTIKGSIDGGGKLTGTLSSSSVSCNGIPGTVTGSISATKQ